ncbi:MAG: DNA/RNA nuclease SfsA [Lentisphaeria bacterium]|nr:DNA/RNA nuclease SfsA [Lentisphaeria bacterium]
MKYEKVVPAEFLTRPNRFIAKVIVDGKEETVHVKNTGRCKELLVPGCRIWLSESSNPERKTKYDLIAVEKIRPGKKNLFVNMDSQIPNAATEEWLRKGLLFSENAEIRREVKFGNSRFDFQINDNGRTCFLEVKGVTLEHDGIAMFPDAPTERGVKHLMELISAKESGFDAKVLFVIQMKEIREFRPNDITHKAFGEALRLANKKGVQLLAYDCTAAPDSIEIDASVKINLNE